MENIRHQIVESFFNPLLHFLPLLTFMVMADVWGVNLAWKISFSVNVFLLIYIFFTYRRILLWFLFSTAIFFVIATIIIIFPHDLLPHVFSLIKGELIVFILFSVSFLFRKYIEKPMIKNTPKNLSMINNLDELFRMMRILITVLFGYISIEILLNLINPNNLIILHNFLFSVFVSVLIFLIVYELIRVTIVRISLIKEEWWPIVNEHGKKIGSIQHLASLSAEKKYMHPIIRVMLISENKILLQKRCSNSIYMPGAWDTAISNHIRLNEKTDECILRTARERYGIKNLKPIFLSNYINEAKSESHYVNFFVACNVYDLHPDPEYIEQIKWWTLNQIDENINSGIFTENFITELNFLKRSGLIDPLNCNCDCRLKDTLKINSIN